jgi:hypothetical protein
MRVVRRSRLLLRAVFASLLVLSLAGTAAGYAYWALDRESGGTAFEVGERATPPANGTTVVTTSMYGNDFLAAFAPNGTVRYYNDSRDIYDDVDPSPAGDATVTYVATDQRADCQATEPCNENVVERVNLTTGETEVVFTWKTAEARNHWHDVDRIDEDRWLVADIALDRAFVYNTSSGIIEWDWSAQADFRGTGGGLFPGDWTHINDVELLPDGRVMVSLRNQDSVAFIDRERGYQPDWTLGEDDNRSVLFEQHNPDYLPGENASPAVIVADSENNRIVEYEREDGSWNRTWRWSDVELQWPRDADRLPGGNTLITDTNGGRVFEVNESGAIVWQVDMQGAYEAERLGTGPESAGGPTATRANLESRTATSDAPARESSLAGPVYEVAGVWKDLLPSMVVNPVLYVLPAWVGYPELLAIVSGLLVAVLWGAVEVHWSVWSVRSPFVAED